MKNFFFKAAGAVMIATCLQGVPAIAQTQTINLPQPQTQGGLPLMQALKNRASNRAFASEKPLSGQQISNILWVAAGINRDNGKLTIPTAMNAQDILVYIATANGTYLYEAESNTLTLVNVSDIRSQIGMQQTAYESAPAVLIYVSDQSKLKTDRDQDFLSALHTGSAYQNVYLYAASEGLNTFVAGSINRESLSQLLLLGPNSKVEVAQPIGYPPSSSEE